MNHLDRHAVGLADPAAGKRGEQRIALLTEQLVVAIDRAHVGHDRALVPGLGLVRLLLPLSQYRAVEVAAALHQAGAVVQRDQAVHLGDGEQRRVADEYFQAGVEAAHVTVVGKTLQGVAHVGGKLETQAGAAIQQAGKGAESGNIAAAVIERRLVDLCGFAGFRRVAGEHVAQQVLSRAITLGQHPQVGFYRGSRILEQCITDLLQALPGDCSCAEADAKQRGSEQSGVRR